jgi:hypothetical protein
MAPDDPREPRFRYPEELQIEPQVLSASGCPPLLAALVALGFLAYCCSRSGPRY